MSKNYLKLIGARIRELRKEQKLTQEDVADRADLNPNYYGRIERGEINVTIDTLLKIADAFKVDVSMFFAIREIQTSKKSDKELKARVKRLIEKKKPEDLEAIVSLIELVASKSK